MAAASKYMAQGLTFHNWHSWFHGLCVLPSFSQELPSFPLGTLWGCVSSIFLSLACCVWLIHTRHSRFQHNALKLFVSHCSHVHAFTDCGGTKLLIFVLVCYFKVTNNFSYWKNSISLLRTLQSEPRQFLHPDLPSLLHEHITSSLLLSFCLKCMSLKMHS